MSQLKLGMGCTLDGAAPDNKAVERGRCSGEEKEEEGREGGGGAGGAGVRAEEWCGGVRKERERKTKQRRCGR